MAIITLGGFCDSPLWNSSLSWDTTNDSWPEFTQCFQLSVLVWIPCGWLWLTLPFYVYYLMINADQRRPLTVFSITKTLVSVILAGLVLGDLATDTYCFTHLTVVYEAVILQAITYILSALLMQAERLRGIVTSGVLFIFWLLCTITGIIPFYSKIILKEYEKDAVHFGLFYAFYALILLQLVFHCVAEPLPKDESFSGKKCFSPELDASFPSRLWYFWVNSIVIKAFRKDISKDDLWMLHPRDQSVNVVPAFQRIWDGEVNKYYGINTKDKLPNDTLKNIYKVSSKSKQKPSLTWVLFKVYFLELWKSWLCMFTHDLLMFVSPMILKLLIDFAASNDHEWKGYVLAFFMLIIPTLQSTAIQYSFHISMTLGMRIRSALTSTVFRKALSIRNSERKTTTIGEIVNIMSVDCQHMQNMIPYLYILVSAPLQISLALYFLYQQLGPSIFSGVAILILLIPFNGIILSYIQKWEAKQMKVKDIRIKMMNEVLNGMKVIKLYAWEPAFEKKINLIRAKEINLFHKIAYMKALSTFSWKVAPFMVTLASFGTYVLSSPENKLDAEKAFVSLSLFNILRAPINMLPMMVSFLAQLKISINRTEKFLNSSDIPKDIVIHTHIGENSVQVIKGKFTWDREDSSSFTLKDINIKIPSGKLVAIVGSVGAGKSSLISAILGEMEKIRGEVEIQGKVAYVPQEAWIQNETLMNNILFGKKLKQDMYDRIVHACAMQPDIDILPGGSQAEIGEKGINLSGGQRQRVSLARAVYQNADIYLFDDPLSAVDSHVGKHIFNQVIGNDGLLQNKTRILVTHRIQWLPKVDYILVLNNGEISENGTYEDLLAHDGPFAQFLQTYLTQEEDEEDDEIIELKNRILQRVSSVCSDKDKKNQSIKRKELVRTTCTIENMTTKEEQVNDHIGKSRKFNNSFCNKKSKSGDFEMKDLKKNDDVKGKNLIEAEKSEIGKVKLNVYITYAKSIGLTSSLGVMGLCFLFEAFAVFGNIWLSWWSEDRLANKSPKLNGTEPESKLDIYLGVYGGLGIAQALAVLAYSILASFSLLKGAKCLQEEMLDNVFHCPMNFFDTTPLGRILNRFSKDVDTMDNTLPIAVRRIITTLFIILSTLFTISYTMPIFMSIIVPIAVLYYVIQNYYLPTSRQLKRIESVSRSPIYSIFSETLAGAASIRAYGVQKEFQEKLENMLDNNLTSFSMSQAANRWLGMRLECLGNIIVFAAALFAVSNRDTMTPGSVGLSLSYALNVTFFLSWFVQNRSEVESNIVAVERISEYCNLENEADWYKENHPDNSWPSKGNITFDNYQLRYRPELDLVLKGISCTVNGGEKIGIVGRTGAGKSSLTISLFRLIESAGGNIIIDGQTISELGLHDLRSKLTILPQEPIIFSGALRNNLDPLEQFADEDLWSALELSHLKSFVQELNSKLDYECGENGGNLSVGQRQLICLARSILHKTKILVLDEATAAVDMETDQLIQNTIRTQFKDTTILTIAHRLNTIMDYDRILVLDKGLLEEFDSPAALLKNKESLFYGMAKNAGLV